MNKIENILLIFIVICIYFISIFNKNNLQKNFSDTITLDQNKINKSDLLNNDLLVVAVVDGDTIVLQNGWHVRYIGINAPEVAHESQKEECMGKVAAQKNAELVLGKIVILKSDTSDTDKYGRKLRYVYVGDDLINSNLVKQGFAYVFTVSPDTKYEKEFNIAENHARINRLGVWKNCNGMMN